MYNKENWNKLCECGCGTITKFKNRFILGHSRKNKKQTKEHKLKRLQSWKDNGNSERMSERMKINNPAFNDYNKARMKSDKNPAKSQSFKKRMHENNPYSRDEVKLKIKQTKLEKYNDENYNNLEKYKQTCLKKYNVDNPAKVKELLEKRVATYCQRLADGKHKSKNSWKCGEYLRKNGLTEWFDSSFEEKMMNKYDFENINWTKKHGIRIPYINDKNNNTFYIPDFLIIKDGIKTLVEIKGRLKESDILKAKIAIEWCKKNGYNYIFLQGKNQIQNNELSYIK